jgi:hypothetical protein
MLRLRIYEILTPHTHISSWCGAGGISRRANKSTLEHICRNLSRNVTTGWSSGRNVYTTMDSVLRGTNCC